MRISPLTNTVASAMPVIKQNGSAQGFADLLGRLVNDAVTNQTTANELSRQLALGETDEIHAVMIATEKASLSWQLLQQVRNKLTEAYQEIMRMQV